MSGDCKVGHLDVTILLHGGTTQLVKQPQAECEDRKEDRSFITFVVVVVTIIVCCFVLFIHLFGFETGSLYVVLVGLEISM